MFLANSAKLACRQIASSMRNAPAVGQRSLSTTFARRVADDKQVVNAAPKASGGQPGNMHRPTAMDRKYLVWSGKYKSDADIPEYVHAETMERANNKTRIRIANLMMLATLIGCITMIISGKKAAESGDSVHKRNLEWHRQYNESKKSES